MGFGTKKAALSIDGAALSTQPATVIHTDEHFEVPAPYKQPGPRTAVTCLMNVQVRRYECTTPIDPLALTKHAKKLYTKYPHSEVIRAIYRATEVSEFPFSFKLVEQICEWGQSVQGLQSNGDQQQPSLFD